MNEDQRDGLTSMRGAFPDFTGGQPAEEFIREQRARRGVRPALVVVDELAGQGDVMRAWRYFGKA